MAEEKLGKEKSRIEIGKSAVKTVIGGLEDKGWNNKADIIVGYVYMPFYVPLIFLSALLGFDEEVSEIIGITVCGLATVLGVFGLVIYYLRNGPFIY